MKQVGAMVKLLLRTVSWITLVSVVVVKLIYLTSTQRKDLTVNSHQRELKATGFGTRICNRKSPIQ